MKKGGRYIVEKPGDTPKRVQHTKDHPDGHAPRDKKGKRLDRDDVPVEEVTEEEVTEPAEKPAAKSKKQNGSK
ncbi:MAG: hypothetical protein FVQ79_00710 [Planctomycetes bacterium]|nr:hypothetical protein [Planctomycetota bacterium]